MKGFLKAFCKRVRIAVRDAEFGSVVTLYKESGGTLFMGVGYKGSGGSGHAIFELNGRPADGYLAGLLVGTAKAMGCDPIATRNDKDRLMNVATAVGQGHPMLSDYTWVAAVFLNIRVELACYCTPDVDDAETTGQGAMPCTCENANGVE